MFRTVRKWMFKHSHYLSCHCFHGRHDACKNACKYYDDGECKHVCWCECHR